MSGNRKLTDNALAVAESRYFMEGETWEDCANRVGSEVGRVENGNAAKYINEFSEMIYEMDFLPGGRILRNTRRARGSLFNCYVLPIGDSIEEIGQFMKDSLVLWSEGGGVGCNFSFLRPRGAPIKGKGGASSGPVSFLEASDAVANTIESGGSRRAAAIACMHVSHPDIMEFIDAKLIHGKLSHYNISVAVSDLFLEAVEANKDWQFKFAQRDYGVIKAREIWDKIIENMVKCAEPGLLNWKNLQSNNSYYFDPIQSTNPCIVGDTLVATADGRNAVSIKQLAEEGKDIPVFCVDDDGAIVVKTMRNPRITGKSKKILKLTLNDGSILRCTENHKVLTKEGVYKRVDGLNVGDSLAHTTKYKLINSRAAKKKTPYWFWHFGGFNGFHKSEHKIVYESFYDSIPENYVLHHKDFDSLNNAIDNLEPMFINKHSSLHSSLSCAGESNGRFIGVSINDVFEKAVLLSKKLNRRITVKEWKKYCMNNNLPFSRYSIGDYSSHSLFLKSAALKADVYTYNNSSEIKSYKKYLEVSKSTDLDLFFDNGIYVIKICEFCGNIFVVSWSKREQCCCSYSCGNLNRNTNDYSHLSRGYYLNKQSINRSKQLDVFINLYKLLGRKPFKSEWESECKKLKIPYRLRGKSFDIDNNPYVFRTYKEIETTADYYNFVIISIEEDGYEDVYNGTVDEFHNFVIVVNDSADKKSGIISLNCGEVPLGSYGVCNLGSLVLPNFVKGRTTTNWKKMEQVLRSAVRFLDNIIDINKYVLKDIDISAHNGRRIGIGVMGLAEYLFTKKLRYGSKEAVLEVERLMRFIRDIVYDASIQLAVEKGAFPKFDPIQYGKAHFIRTLPVSTRMDIKKHGTRNVTLMAIAPTGTISLLPEATSGIEPLFRKAYLRSDRVSDRMYVHPIYKDALMDGSIKDIKEWFVDTDDLEPADHFETQAIIQKYVDGALSKTINLPKDTTANELSDLTLEYINDLKGVTVYVDESRGEQILNKVSEKEIKAHLKSEEKLIESADVETLNCATGKCEI